MHISVPQQVPTNQMSFLLGHFATFFVVARFCFASIAQTHFATCLAPFCYVSCVEKLILQDCLASHKPVSQRLFDVVQIRFVMFSAVARNRFEMFSGISQKHISQCSCVAQRISGVARTRFVTHAVRVFGVVS